MVIALAVSDVSITGHGGKVLLDQISFNVSRGERIGLIGQSGSGKSLTAAALCGLLRPPLTWSSGTIAVNGQTIDSRNPRQWRQVRGRGIFQIFQSPASALNPARRIGAQLMETSRLAGHDDPADSIETALNAVSLLPNVYDRFPYQLSGGMKQRVLIAMALLLRPSILIADEPTTGLDVLTEGGILDALNNMVDTTGTALVFISHDLRAVRKVADRVLVMDCGQIVEDGPVSTLSTSRAPAAQNLTNAAQTLQTIC